MLPSRSSSVSAKVEKAESLKVVVGVPASRFSRRAPGKRRRKWRKEELNGEGSAGRPRDGGSRSRSGSRSGSSGFGRFLVLALIQSELPAPVLPPVDGKSVFRR